LKFHPKNEYFSQTCKTLAKKQQRTTSKTEKYYKNVS